MEVDEDSDPEIETIDLHICQGKIFVWNSQDVKVMRETHHIIGSLVGGLPRAPRQNTQLGLPLQLMPEEVNVLLEYGAARIVNVRTHKPNAKDVDTFENDRKNSFMEQQELWTSRQAQKKQELAHVIEVGRMSRKQRRAEKAMKKRQKQETAKSKSLKHGTSELDSCKQTTLEEAPRQETSLNMEQEKSKSASLSRVDDLAKRGLCAARLDQHDLVMSGHESCARLDEGIASKLVDTDDNGHATSTDQHQREPQQGTQRKCKNDLDHIVKQAVSQKDKTLPHDTAKSTCSVTIPHATISCLVKGNPDTEAEMAVISCKEAEQTTQCVKSTKQNPYAEGNFDVQSTGGIVVESELAANSCKETENIHTCLEDTDQNTCVKNRCTPQSTMSVKANQTKEIASSHRKDQSRTVLENNESVNVTKSQQNSTSVDRMQRKLDSEATEKELDQGCLVQVFTATPSVRKYDHQTVSSWNYPETSQDILRCKIFSNFWEQGYYLTSGSKFGGDFLVYPGDPFLYHSLYVVVCLPYKKPISPLDIVAFGRMASNVKKTVVLCSVDEADEVVYTSVQWTGFS